MVIKRYDLEHVTYIGDRMEQADDGDWVMYDDHLAALREQQDIYEAVLKAKEELLVAYRIGKRSIADKALTKPEKLKPKLDAIRAWKPEEGGYNGNA